jgi:hypothetical protein
MTLAEKHAEIVKLDAELTRAQRVAGDAAVGEATVSFEVAYRAAQAASVALLTALASMTPVELKQGPARTILLQRVAVR